MEVNEIVVGGRESGARRRKNEKKQLLVVRIERKGRDIGQMYAQHLKNRGSKELREFFTRYMM